ncbi:unnamed protein product [Cylicocyclus nassatus]|uniref:Methyltransferase type 11 domain-containing protein n=1 Tax=Cylicocyclus nassatus TaxID=53992 RepID=A0AA36H213_CYLNA|nr:unnamed protein product [Cylicocyclus nassatus]
MSLLPKTTSEFTDPKFWRNFFAARKSPFEWYGDYDVLGVVVEKYLKTTDAILQIGCGNSQLAAQLYDNGYRTVHSIDTDAAVIDEQRLRNKERPELVFGVDDATSLSFGDESFSAVVDKGTLDALLPPEATELQMKAVENMFTEVDRVLRVGGRYQVVTLAQQHIVQFWSEYFRRSGRFLLRVHEVENRASGFPMPVFVFIATKLRNPMNVPMPIEFCRATGSKVERYFDQKDLLSTIAAEQELSQFVHHCSRKLEAEASIAIESSEGNGPRYRIFIVDKSNARQIQSYAVFIVPLGREGEWIFFTEKGRRTLLEQAQKDRLAVVILSRDLNYSSLKDVQDELGPFVSRLDPREKGGMIDFLSCGSVDVRNTRATGESKMNGKWTVEDVVIDEQEYRRLIFLSSSNIVQSEAPLKIVKGKKTVNLDRLSCDHHTLMLAGLSLLPQNPFANPSNAPLKLAVLGLGGGLLASFLMHHLTKAVIDGIELDPDVVEIATKWFALPRNNSRMKVKVIDAIDYLEEAAKRDDQGKLDMLFVDVAGPVHDSGLSCPPAVFLTDPVLCNMKKSLAPNGIIALNLVTRDEEVSLKAKRSISAHFPTMYHIHSEEDVNEVLLLSPSPTHSFDPLKFSQTMRTDIPWVKDLVPVVKRIKPIKLP